MNTVETVVLGDLELEDPHELRHASQRWARDITTEAAAHGITVTPGGVSASLRLAAHAGHIRSASVRLPDRDEIVFVVEASDVLPKMGSFFAAVASGEVTVPREAFVPAAAPKRSNWNARLWHRVARAPGVGALTDSWFERSPQALCEHARSGPLSPYQHVGEIAQLLTLMMASPPRSVLEIGTANGGTTYLLARFGAPNAVVVTCDLFPRVSREALQRRARRRQSVEVLALDSHSPEGREQLFRRFPDGVDLLFIDGDHSYEGALDDLVTYGRLASGGALIVFHDIVDDYRTRYGIATPAWVGGVPRLWHELRNDLPDGFEVHEFVDDVGQDGFGIGVLACPVSVRPGDVLVDHVARLRPM